MLILLTGALVIRGGREPTDGRAG